MWVQEVQRDVMRVIVIHGWGRGVVGYRMEGGVHCKKATNGSICWSIQPVSREIHSIAWAHAVNPAYLHLQREVRPASGLGWHVQMCKCNLCFSEEAASSAFATAWLAPDRKVLRYFSHF